MVSRETTPEAIDIAREKIFHSANLDVDRDTFMRALSLFEVIPIENEGRIIGGIALMANEMHIGVTESPRGALGLKYLELFRAKIRQYGRVVTRVRTVNAVAYRFLTRLGFKTISERNGVFHMRCDRCNYV